MEHKAALRFWIYSVQPQAVGIPINNRVIHEDQVFGIDDVYRHIRAGSGAGAGTFAGCEKVRPGARAAGPVGAVVETVGAAVGTVGGILGVKSVHASTNMSCTRG